ncbi:hypothetical protein B0I35DRAFT_406874, partial [Stachybotrys elegans]
MIDLSKYPIKPKSICDKEKCDINFIWVSIYGKCRLLYPYWKSHFPYSDDQRVKISSSKKTSKVEAASAETSTLQSASGCDVNSTYQDLVHRVLQSGAVQQREERASFSASSRSSSCRTLADSIVKDLEHSKDTNSDSFADPHALTSWLAQAGHLSEKEELDRRLSYQTPSTALWLTDTKAYHSWHDSLGPATLFIEGLAGTGKSVLVASMIAHLHKKEPDAVVLYFFFRPGSSKQSPMSLTMSWLVALLLHSAYCQEEFRRFIQRQPSDLTDEALWEFVLASLLSHPTVYCIVDGLDQVELPHTNTITTRLHHIATLRPKSIKVLATSRTREEIRRSTLATSALQLDIEERMRSDIKHLIDYRLRTALPDHDLVEVRNAIARDIFTALPVHAGGPFQYARSLIDSLTGVKPLVDLEKPPHSVEDVYNVMQRLQLHANPSPDKRLLLSLESLQKWTAFTGSHRTNVEVPRADRLLQLQLKPGQTRFQMRDARGVRHQLIRLFIDRGYHRAAPPSKYPLMHALFERVCCAVSCLEVFFEYGDNVNFNLRDPHGRTVLHAACNARVLKAAYLLAGNAHVPRKDVWFHGTSFFLKMPAYKADVFAVDNGGRTALHILLNNPSMCEDHILTFLDRHGSTDLVCRRDKH